MATLALFLWLALPATRPAVFFTLQYTDGSVVQQDAGHWERMRGDGVDVVWFCNPACTQFSGQSVYWLYHEGDHWVAGGGGVGPRYYDKPGMALPPEILFYPDGRQESRAIQFMPDLKHDQVKLGWWRAGTGPEKIE